jgi:hypothetical protein
VLPAVPGSVRTDAILLVLSVMLSGKRYDRGDFVISCNHNQVLISDLKTLSKMFLNRVLRRIFGPKTEKITLGLNVYMYKSPVISMTD